MSILTLVFMEYLLWSYTVYSEHYTIKLLVKDQRKRFNDRRPKNKLIQYFDFGINGKVLSYMVFSEYCTSTYVGEESRKIIFTNIH